MLQMEVLMAGLDFVALFMNYTFTLLYFILVILLSKTNYNDLEIALLFKALILVGMKLSKNLFVRILGKRYCVRGQV